MILGDFWWSAEGLTHGLFTVRYWKLTHSMLWSSCDHLKPPYPLHMKQPPVPLPRDIPDTHWLILHSVTIAGAAAGRAVSGSEITLCTLFSLCFVLVFTRTTWPLLFLFMLDPLDFWGFALWQFTLDPFPSLLLSMLQQIWWLDPELTYGNAKPFVFTQGHSVCNRSFFPCFDTPAVKCTYSATVKVSDKLV